MLLSSHCITFYMEWASFLSLRELSSTFVSLDQFPKCYHFNIMLSLADSSSNVGYFCRSISSGTYPTYSWQFLPFIQSAWVSSTIYWVSWTVAVSLFPKLAICCVIKILFSSNFTSSNFNFISLLHFNILWPISFFQLCVFVKYPMGLSLGEPIPLVALPIVWTE